MAEEREPLGARCERELLARARDDGGFSGLPEGEYRPDATAWAVLALEERPAAAEAIARGRSRLAREQRADGRVPVRPDHAEAAWPTPLAVLAWRGAPEHDEPLERAVAFLLATTGQHWPVSPDSPTGHDTSLRGWPWILGTHSWIEPTALAVLALDAVGRGGEARVREATALLLDRMLPVGGWNYGNTTVFGSELRPLPESTGVALHALAGRVARERVAPSLAYLAHELGRVRTPFTVGWGVLGLAAWGERPAAADGWLAETLAREERLGPFDTVHLALLALADRAREGLLPKTSFADAASRVARRA